MSCNSLPATPIG
jgi:hypothetical protein